MRAVILVSVGTLLTPVLAAPHHSFPARYEGNEPVMLAIEGDVESFNYRNPHSTLYVIVSDSSERPQRWTVEWASASLLRRMGVTAERIQPRDHVIVHGYAAKDPTDHRLLLERIERPSDGWKWSFRR
jgi:hypothetical protein